MSNNRKGCFRLVDLPFLPFTKPKKSLSLLVATFLFATLGTAAAQTAVDAKVSEVSPGRHLYYFEFTKGGKVAIPVAKEINFIKDGDWTNSAATTGLDFSTSYFSKRLAFEGNIKELVLGVLIKHSSLGYEPDFNTRIITAAHRDYDLNNQASSPSLATSGIVEINANGFASGGNAKSGWVNMPAKLVLDEAEGSRYVRLSGISFWVADGGFNWLSFHVEKATVSDDPLTPGDETEVASVVNQSPAPETNGDAVILIGQSRFHVALDNLIGKLRFIADSSLTANKAVYDGNLEELKTLIQADPTLISSKDTMGYTPLHWAVFKGNTNMVQWLLANKADLSAQTRTGYTPLELAIRTGQEAAVTMLISNTPSVNQKDNEGFTPLHYAVFNGDMHAALLLIGRGADISMLANNGESPLHCAAQVGSTVATKLLMAKGANIDSRDILGQTPLFYAAKNNHLEVMTLLMDNHAKVNATNNDGFTALHLTHDPETIALLRKYGGRDYYWDGITAAENGNVEMLQRLFAEDSNLLALRDASGNTLLQNAAKQAQFGTMQWLIENHADINAKNNEGCTALISAAKRGQLELVKWLVENHAELNATDNKGYTAFQWARILEHKDVQKLLHKHGGR